MRRFPNADKYLCEQTSTDYRVFLLQGWLRLNFRAFYLYMNRSLYIYIFTYIYRYWGGNLTRLHLLIPGKCVFICNHLTSWMPLSLILDWSVCAAIVSLLWGFDDAHSQSGSSNVITALHVSHKHQTEPLLQCVGLTSWEKEFADRGHTKIKQVNLIHIIF